MEQHILRATASNKTAASNIRSLIPNKYRRTATAIDRYINHNPWQAIGATAAIGMLIGFLGAKQ